MAAVGGAVALQSPIGERNAERRADAFRITPDPRTARVLSLGHRSTFADLLWLRALPDLAREFRDVEHKRRWLKSVFDVVPDLEPQWLMVYSYGNTYLGFLNRRYDEALSLLERGVCENPQDAELREELAMAYWMYRRDRERTVATLREAVALPGSSSLARAMLTSLLVEERDDVVALGQWAELLDHGNAEVKTRATLEYERTKMKIAVRAAREFQERSGRPPAHADDLRDPALMNERVAQIVLEGLEITPNGRPRSARLEELELADVIRGAEAWCRLHKRDYGRWPTLPELLDNPWGKMPPPPEGRRWHLEDGTVSLVREEG